jgi:hypothetical protein
LWKALYHADDDAERCRRAEVVDQVVCAEAAIVAARGIIDFTPTDR